MKIKRSIGVPAVLLIYLIVLAIYTCPCRNPEISYGQWAGIIAVTLACIIGLYFLLKKREKYRKK